MKGIRAILRGRSKEADALLNETVYRIRECGKQRFDDISDMVVKLTKLTSNSTEFTRNTMNQMKSCVETNGGNMLTMARCLTDIALQAEREGAIFIYQYGVAIARINLSLATLPAALEVCAGTHFMNIGVSMVRTLMQIGQCSLISLYSIITTNDIKVIDHNFL